MKCNDPQLHLFFNGEGHPPKYIPPELRRVTLRKLNLINMANVYEDLRVPPGNHLEKLKHNWEGYSSIRVNQQYRLVFIWNGKEAEDVQFIDYH